MGTLVDNGGCYFNGEIKNWQVFRQSLCHSSDDMGLGWVYKIANVLSVYLQKTVADMSNKEQEAVVVVMDFSKFSEAQQKQVAKALGKRKSSFLGLIKYRKDTFGSNYMDHAKCGYGKEEDLTEAYEQCDFAYLIKG